jgi:Extracytoplasmic function sigma factor YlaC.
MRNQLDDVLQTELDRINVEEQRNDRPYFDISFIKNYPGLFGLMWILFILTMALLMYSDSFGAN